MRRQAGATLIELLISCGLFILALVVIGQLTVRAMTTRSQTEDKNQVFRSATIVLDQMQRDLEHAEAIYSPNPPSDPQGIYHPGDVDAPLLLHTQGSVSSVVGYRWDKTAKTLTRTLYDPSFGDPAVATSWVVLSTEHPKTITGVTFFSVTFLTRAQNYGALLVQSLIAVETGTGPSINLSTSARLKKL
jgi:type II secretory pathway pseudopilin PulG